MWIVALSIYYMYAKAFYKHRWRKKKIGEKTLFKKNTVDKIRKRLFIVIFNDRYILQGINWTFAKNLTQIQLILAITSPHRRPQDMISFLQRSGVIFLLVFPINPSQNLVFVLSPCLLWSSTSFHWVLSRDFTHAISIYRPSNSHN